MQSVQVNHQNRWSVVAIALAGAVIIAGMPVAADGTDHCAYFVVENFVAADDQNLQVVVKRPGTTKTATVDVDANGVGSVCMELAWNVNDIFYNEPVSVRLVWSNAESSTTAEVDIDVWGNPPPAYRVGAAGSTVTWSLKKKYNALQVGDLGFDSQASDPGSMPVASYNPTRNYPQNDPWTITAAQSQKSDNKVTFSVWYNAPARDLRGPQVPPNKLWKVYVWYEMSGSAPAGGGGGAQHNWDAWQSGAKTPPAQDYPFVYTIDQGQPQDPGISFLIPNPTIGTLWKCDNGIPPGHCVGPTHVLQQITVTLFVSTTTKQTDSQGNYEFDIDTDRQGTANSGQEVWIDWICSRDCGP
jgi:hypothetical protein